MVTCLSAFSGCSLSTYIPTAINVPLLKEKNEANVSGGLTANGITAQAAYSPVSNVGLLLNVNANKLKSTIEPKMFADRHLSGQLGAGYYSPLGNWGVFEGYAGYGYTSSDVRETSFDAKDWIYVQDMRGKYSTLFVIQNIGFFRDSTAAAVLSVRWSRITYQEFATTRPTGLNRMSTTIIEPGFTMKFGWPRFKFFFQVIHPIPRHEDVVFTVDPYTVTLGFEVLVPGGK